MQNQTDISDEIELVKECSKKVNGNIEAINKMLGDIIEDTSEKQSKRNLAIMTRARFTRYVGVPEFDTVEKIINAMEKRI